MTSQEKSARPECPFDLPLRPGDWGDDIFDANEKQVVTLYGNERKPETAAQRDYVIRACNSFDDMLAFVRKQHAETNCICGLQSKFKGTRLEANLECVKCETARLIAKAEKP